jgi:hypothetical protein
MNEPVRDANVALVAVKLREGKTKRQICEEMDITRQTLAAYLKEHLADELKSITQEELQLHLRVELERCDELEDRIEAGVMNDAKRIQLLLAVVKHRCELLGLFPKQGITVNTGDQQIAPVNINFTVVGRNGQRSVVDVSEYSARRPALELPAAPDEGEAR